MENKAIKIPSKVKLRKHLNADSLLKTVYSDFNKIPNFRPSFKNLVRKLQRAKALDPYKYIERYVLVSLNGTGFFSSKQLIFEACLVKKKKEQAKP